MKVRHRFPPNLPFVTNTIDSNELLSPPPMTRWMMLLVKLVKFSSGALQLEHAPPTQLLPVVRLFSADIFGGRKIETREVVGLIRWKKKGREGNGRRGKGGSMEGQVLTPLPRHRVSGTSFVQRAFRLPRNIQPGDRASLIFAQTFLPGRDRDKILDGCAPFRLSDYTVSTRIR